MVIFKRKMPMFKACNNEMDYFDFEWPQKATLKTITDVKQLRLKEIRYTQDQMGIVNGIKFVSDDNKSAFYSASKEKKCAPIVLPANYFYG